jgi:hypothetical protein
LKDLQNSFWATTESPNVEVLRDAILSSAALVTTPAVDTRAEPETLANTTTTAKMSQNLKQQIIIKKLVIN